MPTPGDIPGQSEFAAATNGRLEEFLRGKREQVAAIDPSAAPLVDSLLALTSGGKKLRPLLAWLGGQAADQGQSELAMVELGVALELFQGAALIHDDVIDRSDTRRGQPSTHRRFAHHHRDSGFTGDADHFGVASAILVGDLALSWAAEAFTRAEAAASAPSAAAREVFQRMHTEVITGQHLDVLAEVAPPADTESAAVGRARNVLTYKAAKYSTEYPLVLGCALAGGGADLQHALAESGLPLGIAFQLRDDILGVFGDPDLTGKPVGDDLREGKRTELIAYGLHRSPAPVAAELESLLGDPTLSEADVISAREMLRNSGALAEVEDEIDRLALQSARSRTQLAGLGVDDQVLQSLSTVADLLLARTS